MPTYKDNIPQPSDIISTSQDDILQNFESIPNVIDPNQYSVIMPVAPAPDIADAKQVGLYAKLDSNSAVNEIWFKRGISDAGVDGVPITGGIASITPLPAFVTAPIGHSVTPVSCGWNRISNGAWSKYCVFTIPSSYDPDYFNATINLNLIGPAYSNLFECNVFNIYPASNPGVFFSTTTATANTIIVSARAAGNPIIYTFYISTTGM